MKPDTLDEYVLVVRSHGPGHGRHRHGRRGEAAVEAAENQAEADEVEKVYLITIYGLNVV